MMNTCFAGFILDEKILLSIISISFSLGFLFIMKNKNISNKLKLPLIYGHLIFLLFPIVLFTTNFGCGITCLSCYTNVYTLVAYSLPTTLVLGALAGFIVIPWFFMFSNKGHKTKNLHIISFVKKYSKKLKIKIPHVYIIDKAKPLAFSFRSFTSAIFLSAGLLDILNTKETESVLLHELSHIKDKSSALKISSLLMNIFSPFSNLANFHDKSKEERKADKFAIKEQKTKKYLISTKNKIDKFISS